MTLDRVIENFPDLNDVPHAYAGFAAYSPVVKATEDGMEFAAMATRDYVDNAIDFHFDYFYGDTASDIGGIYYDMTDNFLGGGESSLSSAALGAGDDQPIVNFATLSGEPSINDLPAGIYDFHIHVERTGGTRSVIVYAKLYSRTVGGAETLVGTSELSNTITSKINIRLHMITGADATIDTTDRLVVKWFANIGSAGSATTVTVYQEGTTDSHFTFQTSSAILSNVFLRRDGAVSLTANWNVGGFNLTNVGTIGCGTITATGNFINAASLSGHPTGVDTFAVISRTGSSGAAPFNQAGSLYYRPRLSDIAGRGGHYFYVGATPTLGMTINESGNVVISGTLASGAITSTGSSLFAVAGIGIARTEGTLHVHTATAGAVVAHTSWDDLVVENNEHGGISILTPDGSIGGLFFTSPANTGSYGGYVTYTHTLGRLRLWTTKATGYLEIGSGGALALTLDASQNATFTGNVGIGGTPSTKLHVIAGAGIVPSSPGTSTLMVQDNDSTSGYATVAIIGGETTGSSVIEFGDRFDRDGGRIRYIHADDSMVFYTAANPRMTIDSTGNVGIGVAPTLGQLHIVAGTDQTGLYAKSNYTGGTFYAGDFFADGNNASAVGLKIRSGLDSGANCYSINLYDGGNTIHGGLRILSSNVELWQSSSRTLKDKIANTSINAKEIISKLRVADFEMKSNPGSIQTGFVAEEMLEAYSPAAAQHPAGLSHLPLGVVPMNLIPVLVKHNQEMQVEIKSLEARIAVLDRN